MRLVLLTYGSRGDVEPFVALAKGLARAGHAVRLAAPSTYAGLVQGEGLDFAPLPGNPDRLVAGLVQQAGGNWMRMVGVMSRYVAPLAREVFEASQVACAEADVIVHSFLMTNAGHEIARLNGAQDVSAQLFPVFSTTGEFAAVVFPDLPLGAGYRRLTHFMTTQTFWLGGRLLYRRVRQAYPHLPPLTEWPFAPKLGRPTPILYGFSTQVVPRPSDWGDGIWIPGYWFLDRSDERPVAEELRRFVEGGTPPIYIGFGSTVAAGAGRLAQEVLKALALTGQRGVLASGGGGLQAADLPATVRLVEAVPHGWLFPRMGAVVHHGGAGTTGAALRAGVPNVVVPFTSDQPFWGRRVFRLGVGPKPIPASRFTAARLARAISQALTDQEMRRRAYALGERLRAEDGVARAVELIEAYALPGG